VGEMIAEKKRRKVRVLDKEKIMRAEEIRIVVKGGKVFTFQVLRPLNRKNLILQNGDSVLITTLSGLAKDVEEYFKRVYGLEPLYVYPAFQQTLLE
jgi:hypothetical protein